MTTHTHRYSRRIVGVLALALTLGMTATAAADTYPSRSVRMIVPWVVGGSTDVLGRLLAETLSKRLDQTVVVENRPGATGTIGTNTVAKARPDGYTVLLGTNSTFAIAPHLYPDLPYNHIKDFAPVGFVASNQQILVVNPAMPVKTLKEFVDYARAHPGDVTFGSSGKGGSSHLAMELLMSMTDTRMLHVPYKGGASSLQSVLANETNANFSDVTTIVPLVKGGQLRALGSSGTRRAPGLPDVPTIAEAGVPGFQSQTAFALFVPTGTPPEHIARLNTALNESLADPALAGKLKGLGFELNPGTPKALSAYVVSESEKWGKLIKARGIKFE